MIKRIQQYLLLHHPMIWNIRLVPMLLILIGVHLIFFLIGYFSADVSFKDEYHRYYSIVDNLGMTYFGAVLTAILILIGWLVFYMRNNGFRIFYPRKTSQLYVEWLCVLLITLGLSFVPLTLTWGSLSRWRSVASYEEAKDVLKMLDKVKLLIPSNLEDYKYKSSDKLIPIPEGTVVDMDRIDINDYSFEYNSNYSEDGYRNGGITINGYKGYSLLYYYNNDFNYYDTYSYVYDNNRYSESEYTIALRSYHKGLADVKSWLVNQRKDSIGGLMSEFLTLQDKHGLKGNLDVDIWMRMVYNPPFYALKDQNKIAVSRSEYESRYHDYEKNYGVYTPPAEVFPFLEYNKLKNNYNFVLTCYEGDNYISGITMFCLCFGFYISLFVFSFRVTSGKTWLAAFIGAGVLIFVSTLINVAIAQAGNNSDSSFILQTAVFWVALFVGLLVFLFNKVRTSGNKGRSYIPMNFFLWLLPTVIPFICFGSVAYLDIMDHDYYSSLSDDDIINIFLLDVVVVTAAMWFVTRFIRKWKSIPEE